MSSIESKVYMTQDQITVLLNEIEVEFNTIQNIFREHLPDNLEKLSNKLHVFHLTVQKLDKDYGFLVAKIESDYASFCDQPDQETLNRILGSIKSLQVLLGD